MLIALRQQNSYTKQSTEARPDAVGLDEFVIALDEDFGERFGGGD